MSFHTTVNVQDRKRLMRWLAENTSIPMEKRGLMDGGDPLHGVTRDVTVRASRRGLSFWVHFSDNSKPPGMVGPRFQVREFCEKVRDRFPRNQDTKPTAEKRQVQTQLQGVKGMVRL